METLNKLIISLFISIGLLFIVLYFNHLLDQNLNALKYEDFELFKLKSGNLVKSFSFMLGEEMVVLIYNVSGFERDENTNSLDLNVILKLKTLDGVVLHTKRVILPFLSNFQQEIIPQIKVLYTPKGLIPDTYELEVIIYDLNGEKSFSKSKQFVLSGKVR